jgi:hypothetical protein
VPGHACSRILPMLRRVARIDGYLSNVRHSRRRSCIR